MAVLNALEVNKSFNYSCSLQAVKLFKNLVKTKGNETKT